MSVAGEPLAKDMVTDYCNGLTPTVAMSPDKPQLSLIRKEDAALYQKAVGLALIRMIELINVTNTLTDNQIDDLIARIGKTFYYFRLEELLYVLEKAINGRYGKTFNTLDAGTVMTWLERYDVDERTHQAVELARVQLGEPKRPLTKQELAEFLEKAKVKNTNPFVDNSHKRLKDRTAEANQDFASFRAQYFKQLRQAQEATDSATNQPEIEL